METQLYLCDEMLHIMLEEKQGSIHAVINGQSCQYETERIAPNCIVFTSQNQKQAIYYVRAGDSIYIAAGGKHFQFGVIKQDSDSTGSVRGSNAGGLNIVAPMPGIIIQVNVMPGDHVKEGECLAIVEAMKMETNLVARCDAQVKKVHADKGEQVNGGDLIIELEGLNKDEG